MGETLGDLLTLFLIGVSIWVFLPGGLRASVAGVLRTAVGALAELVRAALPVVEDVAHRAIVGRPVNRSTPPAPALMLRAADEAPVDRVSSQDGQDDDTPPAPAWSRDDLRTLYTLLRRHGVKREELRPLLKPFGVPLSNDVWAEAAPPPPPAQTPIAERPYDPAAYRGEQPVK